MYCVQHLLCIKIDWKFLRYDLFFNISAVVYYKQTRKDYLLNSLNSYSN